MKLGGYAHTNGITFFCDVFKLKTTKSRGRLKHQLDWIIPMKWIRNIENKPIIGGISFFYYQWKIVDRRIRVAFLLLLSFLTLDEYFSIPYISDFFDVTIERKYLYGIIFILSLIGFKKIKRLLRYHGAEHKVINCFLKHGVVEESLVKQSSRFNKGCGSNITMIFFGIYIFFYFVNYDPLWLQLLLFILTLQIFKKVSVKDTRYDYLINLLQWLTVWEPTDEEIQVAIQGFTKLHDSYLIYQKEVMERNRQLRA